MTVPANDEENPFLAYCLPDIGEAEIAEVVDSLRSGWVTMGPKVKRFEELFAETCGASHAIAVNSCTAGLEIALDALGLEPGDEVILPTMTFCSAANVILHRGGVPVPVDVGPDYNIDPAAAERAITERTRALMPVHFAGQACDLDRIHRLATENSLSLVVDCAHAVGSTYRGHSVAADALLRELDRTSGQKVAAVNVFSFYATKNLTTGEGGMMTTSDEEIASRASLLRLHGMSRDAWNRYGKGGSWSYDVVAAGYKSNMTDIQAAIGIHQLARLPSFTSRRQELAEVYREELRDVSGVSLPVVQPERNHVYHLFVVELELERLSIDRSRVSDLLREHGIGTSVHFIPLHHLSLFRQHLELDERAFPNADRSFERILSLPLYPRMSRGDVRRVASALKTIVGTHRR